MTTRIVAIQAGERSTSSNCRMNCAMASAVTKAAMLSIQPRSRQYQPPRSRSASPLHRKAADQRQRDEDHRRRLGRLAATEGEEDERHQLHGERQRHDERARRGHASDQDDAEDRGDADERLVGEGDQQVVVPRLVALGGEEIVPPAAENRADRARQMDEVGEEEAARGDQEQTDERGDAPPDAPVHRAQVLAEPPQRAAPLAVVRIGPVEQREDRQGEREGDEHRQAGRAGADQEGDRDAADDQRAGRGGLARRGAGCR